MSKEGIARGARGGSVVILGRLIRLAIQLLGTVFLARLLTPAEFGLVAMVLVFTNFGALLRDFGVSTAALQARLLSKQQASNLFWLSSALGLSVAIALVLATPLLVNLYDEPRLAEIAPVLAVGLVLDALQSQIQIQFVRGMKFVSLTVTDIVAQTLALSTAIAFALLGAGYWSLVAQTLTASLSLLVLRVVVLRWLPNLPKRGAGSWPLLKSGAEYGFAQLLTFAANNADILAIGSRWGATNLGFYNRAFELYNLPRSAILDPLTQVVIPTVHSVTADGERRAADLLLSLQFALSAVFTTIYLATATTADWLIPLALGEQWRESVVLFQVLAIAGLFSSFGTVSYWTFIISGQSRQLLYLHLVTKPLGVLLIVLAMPHGVKAIALAYVAGLVLAWPVNLVWLSKTVGQESWQFFLFGVRIILAASVAFLCARLALAVFPVEAYWANVLFGTLISIAVYVVALIVVPGGLQLVKSVVRSARLILPR